MIDPTEYIGWTRSLANELARKTGADSDDLAGDGLVGLMKAVRSYDPARGVPFMGYARPRILGEMVDGLRRMSWPSRKDRAKIATGALPTRYLTSLDQIGGFDTADTSDTEAAALLRVAFAELPERLRRVVTAWAFERIDTESLGVREGVTGSRISQLVATARDRLVA